MLAWQVVKNFFARTQDASDSLPLEVRSCPSSQTQNCACYIWLLSPFSSWEVNLSFALAGGGSHQNPVRASSYSNPDHLPRHRCSSGVGCTYINMRNFDFLRLCVSRGCFAFCQASLIQRMVRGCLGRKKAREVSDERALAQELAAPFSACGSCGTTHIYA